MKTKNCDECQYFVSDIDTSECLKDHKLTFYVSRDNRFFNVVNCKPRRKCEDFKELER